MRALLGFSFVLLTAVSSMSDEITWACKYSDKGVQVEFNNKGKPTVSHGEFGMEPFILALDTDKGEAKLVANSAVEVIPMMSGPTLSFIEDTPSGPSIITLFIGSISSTIYAIEYGQRNFSQWNPSMIPIKIIMVLGIFLMILQTISTFFKDLAKVKGITIP